MSTTSSAGVPASGPAGARRLTRGVTTGQERVAADPGFDLDVDELDESPVDDPGSGLRRFGLWLAIAGVVGFAAAFELTVDKIRLLQDPDFIPSCNISPILSCGSVMKTPQASAFGFANSIIGVGAFAVVAAIGLGVLAGARYRWWYWAGLQAGAVFGIVFIHWLAFQSMFHIGALCPWCMVVWSVTIPTFLSVTAYVTRTGQLGRGLVPLGRFVRRHYAELIVVWYLVFVGTAGVKFWDYWQTLI